MIMQRNSSSEGQSSLYRAIWIWHFGAGLFALPFLVILAVTGGLYLFKDEIDQLAYRHLLDVPAHAGSALSTSTLVQKAESAMNGHVLQVTLPAASTRSLKLIVRTAADRTRTVFVDPYTGDVMGSTAYGGIMQIIRKIHSLQYFGFAASCLMEVTAGWTIVLAVSGLYLWWPRGRRGGIITVRGTPHMRMFWRDLHAVTGVAASLVIVFLAVTGLPWTKVWGKNVQQWTTAAGLGTPKPPAAVLREWQLTGSSMHSGEGHHHAGHEFQADLPWAMEKTRAPASTPPKPQQKRLGIDAALASVTAAGLPRPFSLALPIGPRGAYMASYRPNRVENTRIIYVDQFDGHILADTGFAQYGPAAKAIEWGIAVHQGLEYGPMNRILMLLGCIAILILAVSAPVMWWKRRAKGSWGLPPAPADPRIMRGVTVIMGIVGVILPLTGMTMLAVWLGTSAYEKLKSTPA
jgi:uncharacterized iron-regulated membrane protein